MAKTENAKKFSLIAAICYTIYALYYIIIQIIYVSNFDSVTITALCVIFWISALGMAVTLFMKNKKAVVAAAGVYALFVAYCINCYCNHWKISYFSLWNLCDFVAYAGAVVLIALSIKGNSAVKKIWFVPALVLLVGFVIGWINSGYLRFLSIVWVDILLGLFEIGALLFVGMWIKEDTTPAAAAPVNEYATFNPQAMCSTPVSSSTIGGADKLKIYKDLLDSGTITQEEFDAKKKEILGL